MGRGVKRLAPVVLMKNELAFTTRSFKIDTYLGEPQNLVRIFSELDAHEIVVINLGDLNSEMMKILEAMSKGSYVPLHFAGGINSASDAALVVGLGFEKIGLELRSLDLDLPKIQSIAERVGSTSTSASISVVCNNLGDYILWDWKSGTRSSIGLQEAVNALNGSGCGELKVNSVDRDGSGLGPDIKLASQVREFTDLPLVYQGGVQTQGDVDFLWSLGIDCVATGTMLSTYGPHKAALAHYPLSDEMELRWR